MKAASTFYSEVDPTHAAISDWYCVKTYLRRGPGTMRNKLATMLVAWKHAQFVGETPRG